jgi:uncharacterized phage-associated protein
MTHLKLQKLVFFSYGAAVGHDHESDFASIIFEPWPHGPVNRHVWKLFRSFGSGEIPAPAKSPAAPFSPALSTVLADAVDVYARMGAWALRCESHLERPWTIAHESREPLIDADVLREHFRQKFAVGQVRLPAHLGGSASAALDFVPAARFRTLHEMAESLRHTAAA